jgi:DNA-binding winged helix-turn-helix (wHTH) protein
MPLSSPLFDWDGWTFEPKQWRLTNASGPVALPNKTLALLSLLLDRAPGLVSKDDILSIVWAGTVVEEGNIAFHVATLRKALDTPGSPSCIETVRGRGYRFVAPLVRRYPAPPAPRVISPPVINEPAAAFAQEGPVAVTADTAPAAPLVRFEPVALLVAAIGLLLWAAVANLTPQIHDVLVMPARAADLSAIDAARAPDVAACQDRDVGRSGGERG